MGQNLPFSYTKRFGIAYITD